MLAWLRYVRNLLQARTNSQIFYTWLAKRKVTHFFQRWICTYSFPFQNSPSLFDIKRYEGKVHARQKMQLSEVFYTRGILRKCFGGMYSVQCVSILT